MSDIVYLYGFVPSDSPPPPSELRGVGGAAVTLLDIGAARAAVSHVTDPAFDTDRIEPRLADLSWVGEQGIAHERVVTWFVDHADILPARLFSMYSSEAALQTTVAGSVTRLADRLRAFAGRREWDLKVAYDAAALEKHGSEISRELHALTDQLATAPPGRRYLLERKRADVAKREVRRSARRLADELLAALGRHALETRMLPLSQELTAGTVVLSAALLVDRIGESALRREAAERTELLAPIGLIVTISGPWAPYRFVNDDVAT